MIDHQLADLLAIGGPVELTNDAPAGDNSDPIRQIHHFIEIFTNQQHRGTGVASPTQIIMDRGAGPHIEAACWRVRDHNLGIAG